MAFGLVIAITVSCTAFHPVPHHLQRPASPGKLGGENAQCNRDYDNGRTGQDQHGDTDDKDRNADDRHDKPLQFFDSPIIHCDSVGTSRKHETGDYQDYGYDFHDSARE